MKALIIGEGMLGCALIDALSEAGHSVVGTSREALSDKFYLDLTKPIPELPPANVIYICAAVASYRECEGNQSAWVVNADAPVEIVRRCLILYGRDGPNEAPFPVFVSTDALEFMSNAYTRMKAYAESCILPMGAAIIRPRRFGPDNIASLCHLMIRVGLDRKPGVYRWA